MRFKAEQEYNKMNVEFGIMDFKPVGLLEPFTLEKFTLDFL